MALSISTLPDIYPVYTNNLILTATDTTAGNLYIYQFKIYINDVLSDTLNYPANPLTPFDANINLSTILMQETESSVFTGITTAFTQSIASSILKYKVDVFMYSGSTYTGVHTSTGDKYAFNGCLNDEEDFNISDFIFNGANTSNFLTNFHSEREISLTDKAYINTILGNYTTIVSDFAGVKVTRYQADGTNSGLTISNTINNSTKTVLFIDVSPATINATYTNFINSSTLYYTIQESGLRNKTIMKISIIDEAKITKFYNFNYVNRLGGVDFFTASSVDNEKHKIERKTLNQFFTQKTYNTDVEKEISVQTQFLTQYQGDKLKELFTSPAIKLYINSRMKEVQIINTEINIRSRYPKTDMIQYVLTFRYLYKYFSQVF
jgi:hypothetical protein